VLILGDNLHRREAARKEVFVNLIAQMLIVVIHEDMLQMLLDNFDCDRVCFIFIVSVDFNIRLLL